MTPLNNNTTSYTIKSGDLDKYIIFSVTPYAVSGTEIGELQYSNYVGPITQSALPPTSSLDININEFHYDNNGNDINEFVEVRIPQNNIPLNIDNYQIVLYNGSNGKKYESAVLSQTVKNCDTNYCYYVWNVPSSSSIQNGPDGIALVNDSDSVIEFISYEGVFTATNGPAKGVISKDIGIKQSNSTTPENSSIYLDKDGIWKLSEGSNTKGSSNF